MYDVLIKPAEVQIDRKSALIIVPDGVLWKVPFEALQMTEQHLIDKASVTYAISLGALKEMRKRAATKQARVTTGDSVLHFGKSASLDQYAPMQSRIVLDDGLLKLWEVTELNSKAQVVSFFNSSLVQRQAQSGNAFIALSWAWFVAGTPVVVLSRWQADPTDIAAEFHRGLIQKQRPEQALRQGALKVKRSSGRENPYHWSGFMTMGQ